MNVQPKLNELNDTELSAFKAIVAFVIDIGENFKQKSLSLYKRLLENTRITNVVHIKKHIDAFRQFCISNRDSLLHRNMNKLNPKNIVFKPDKIFINLEHIFKQSDPEQTKLIWGHLLNISGYVDPAGKVKDILKKDMENKQNQGQSGNEEKFLSDLINKVESKVSSDTNPMEAVSSILNSGIFTDLISNMNNGVSSGSLDIQKLMGTVQNMMSQMGSMMGNLPQMSPTSAQVEDVTEEDKTH